MDFTGKIYLPGIDKFIYIFLIIDYFNRYPFIRTIRENSIKIIKEI